MNRRVHGTTNTGFLCKEGIMLGNDTRISSTSENKKHDLISDEEVKLFQLCCDPNIVCTLMGDVEEWYKMFRYLFDKKPKSVQGAVDDAKEYLKEYIRNNRRNPEEFGTIIAGHDKGGFQLQGISTTIKQGRCQVQMHNGPVIVIGSGHVDVLKFLQRKSFDFRTLTKQAAANLTFGALMEGCFHDPATGGKFKATLVRKDGSISDTYPVLKVYNALYGLCAQEKATIFIIYSTSISLIFGENEIGNLIGDIWSSRQFDYYNMIAKKADFYVTRVLLKSEKHADEVCECLRRNSQPYYPASLSHIKKYLIDCIRKETLDHFYVGRSSKELVEGLDRLKNAATLKY